MARCIRRSVPAAELESATSGLGNQRSIQLSYAGATFKRYRRFPRRGKSAVCIVSQYIAICECRQKSGLLKHPKRVVRVPFADSMWFIIVQYSSDIARHHGDPAIVVRVADQTHVDLRGIDAFKPAGDHCGCQEHRSCTGRVFHLRACDCAAILKNAGLYLSMIRRQ